MRRPITEATSPARICVLWHSGSVSVLSGRSTRGPARCRPDTNGPARAMSREMNGLRTDRPDARRRGSRVAQTPAGRARQQCCSAAHPPRLPHPRTGRTFTCTDRPGLASPLRRLQGSHRDRQTQRGTYLCRRADCCRRADAAVALGFGLRRSSVGASASHDRNVAKAIASPVVLKSECDRPTIRARRFGGAAVRRAANVVPRRQPLRRSLLS